MKRLKRLTRKKYRITALVLALCMTLSLLPISALAAGTDLAGKAIEEGTFAATGGNVNYRSISAIYFYEIDFMRI